MVSYDGLQAGRRERDIYIYIEQEGKFSTLLECRMYLNVECKKKEEVQGRGKPWVFKQVDSIDGVMCR